MSGKRLNSHCFFSSSSLSSSVFTTGRRRGFSACPLPVEPLDPSAFSTITPDHKSMCFSLLDRLIRGGFVPCAHRVVRRIILQSSSLPDAISAVDFATVRGMEIQPCGYAALVRKLVNFGEFQMAKALYRDTFVSRGIMPDSLTLNSMVNCYSKLGELEEAKSLFHRLISMESKSYTGACSVLIQELCAKARVLEAFECFISINDTGIVLDTRCCCMLVDKLCQRGYLDEALDVFGIMNDRGVPCSIYLYKLLFHGFCKRGRVEEAELLSTEMESQGIFLDKIMYTSLINGYCRGKKMKMAMRIFMKMRKTGCEPDIYTYNTLIHGFFNLGLPDKGWVIQNLMVESGIQPDAVTCHTMIRKYCKEKRADCALMLLDNMSHSNAALSVHCYTTLIAALVKENKFMEVGDLYYKMLDSGVVPDHVMFLTLMKMYQKGHELNLALMLLQAVAKVGCGLDISSFPEFATSDSNRDLELEIDNLLGEIVKSNTNLAVVAFSIYILALCVAKKSEVAFLCMDKMLSLGCEPLLSNYNSLIKCLCQEGLFEDAKSVYNLMQDRGLVPNLATYLIMVSEHCKRGDVIAAVDVLHQMDDRGLKPSVAIYDCVIGCLGRQKKIFQAEYMFKHMLEAGTDPDEIIYVTMINAYSKNGRAIRAHQLFDNMVECGIQPSSHAYTALISGLIKKNMITKGCLYLDRMLKDGLVPNNVLYTSLIKQFLRKGELEFALSLVDLMENCQIEHDLLTYITLFCGVCRTIRCTNSSWHLANKNGEQGRELLFHLLHRKSLVPGKHILRISLRSFEEIKLIALKLMNKIEGTRFVPNLYLYNCMISGLCWINEMHDAYYYLELMQSKGVHPNQVTFTVLINGHIRNGEINFAISLFNTMNANGYIPDRIVYDSLITGLCKAGRLVDALLLSLKMQKRGLFPSKVSYEHLLGSFCANHSSTHALRICEDMFAHDFIPCQYNLNLLLCLLSGEEKLHEAQLIHDMVLLKKSWIK